MKKLKLLLVFALSAVFIYGCDRQVDPFSSEACLDFLYRYMPVDDEFAYDEQFWEDNVAKTLEVRDKMGWDVPEREFLHFVLPVRVADEPLDRFRLEYADSLCEAVKGLSMSDAVLAINTWCYSYINYVPSETGNYSPLGVMYHKGGQCDAMAVFSVAALRAAGIPARKVNVLWPNINLGHSWTEVWVDGKWRFIGSAERHVGLDMSWFSDRASQSFLTSVEVFGNYDGPEPVISRTDRTTRINTLANYTAKLRDAEVRVLTPDSKPVQDANVQFMMYSNGSLATLRASRTDSDGCACMPGTGHGSLVVFAFKGDRYGLCVSKNPKTDIVLDEHLPGQVHFKTVELLIPPPSGVFPQDTLNLFDSLLEENVVIDAVREARVWPNPDSLSYDAVHKASRPHIPKTKLLSKAGDIDLLIKSPEGRLFGRDFSILHFGDECLEPLISNKVTPGSYLLVTGVRPEENRIELGLDVFTIPDNVRIANIPVTMRTDFKY